jgi:hypothetical protein
MNTITPKEMIQSTELAFRNSYKSTKDYPDWSPVSVPFPEGYRPRQYRDYKIETIPYKIEIPLWGIELDKSKWFFGRYGLWHKSFNSKPFFYGGFSEDFLIEHYKDDKYYRLEVVHRLWALGDLYLTPREYQWYDLIDYRYEGNTKYAIEFMMRERRSFHHERASKEARLSLEPFLKPEKTLEAHCKFNKKKILRLIKEDPRARLRIKTQGEISKLCEENKQPAPIFDKKGYWVNRVNPSYKPPVEVKKVEEVIPLKVQPQRPSGRGHRLNRKLAQERRRLQSSLELPKKLNIKRHHLRWIRMLERHLYNILHLSECVRFARNGKHRNALIRDIHKLIKAVPFKSFGTRGAKGSFYELPSWARRQIKRNLWSF